MQNPPPATELLIDLATFKDYVAQLPDNPDIDWEWRPDEESWSLTELVCHLRDVEREVHQERIEGVLENDTPFLPGIDADRWAPLRHYRSQDGPQALVDYLEARTATIQLLESQPPEAWQRVGQHSFFGPTSLKELVNLAVQHDEVHRRQIDELLDLGA